MRDVKAYEGNEPYIFVSYSHDDKNRVLPIIEKLQEKYNVWFDDGIHFGDDYKRTIINHINNCSLFIYMVSLNSLKSEFCQKEIKQANRKNKAFFNVIIEDCLDEEEAEIFMFDYESYQMCLLFETNIDQFIEDLERKAPTAKDALNRKSHPNEKNILRAKTLLNKINSCFIKFKIAASCVSYAVGPSFTSFNIKITKDTSSKAIEKKMPDIASKLGLRDIVFKANVHNSKYPVIEVTNEEFIEVKFDDVLSKLDDKDTNPLQIGFGLDVNQDVIKGDIGLFPHLLISGISGSGKSVFINNIVATLVTRNTPDTLRLVLINPKETELNAYKDLPHLYCPVINKVDKAKYVLDQLIDEMNRRYSLFMDADYCTSIEEYNSAQEEKLPYIIIIIDELSDLLEEDKSLNASIVPISQKARAAGIHIIISVQRATTNVITGVLKANFPTKALFLAASGNDSITFLGEAGAEKLLGKGDMLVYASKTTSSVMRVQAPFIHENELTSIVNDSKEKYQTNYLLLLEE